MTDLKQHLSDYFSGLQLDTRNIEAFQLGYCKSREVWQTMHRWLATEYPRLKSSASKTDEVWAQALNVKIQALDEAPRIHQGALINGLMYYSLFYPQGDKPRDSEFVKSLAVGECSGLTALVSYGLLLETQPNESGVERDDWTFIQGVFQLLASWNPQAGTIAGEWREFTRDELNDIERVFSLLSYFQAIAKIQPVAQGDLAQAIQDTRHRKLQQVYEMGATFTQAETEKILEPILASHRKKSNETEHLQLLISSFNHDTGLIKIGKKLYFYDPGNFFGPVEINNAQQAALLLSLANNFKADKFSPLGIRAFSFNPSHAFPRQDDLLSRLSVVKEKKLNETHNDYCDAFSALHAAAWVGSAESTQLLLTAGAAVDIKDKYGRTPAFIAMQQHYPAVLSALLEHHADVMQKDDDGFTLLHHAVMRGDTETMKVLLTHKADIDAITSLGQTVLDLAIDEKNTEVLELLLKYVPAVEMRHLEKAIEHGNEKVVDILLNHKPPFDLNVEKTNTPLIQAAKYGFTHIVKLLLQHGANPDVADALSRKPLHIAVQFHQTTVLEALLEQGVDVEAKSSLGRRAMHMAAEMGNHAMIEILLAKGASVDAKDLFDHTSLDIAVDNNYPLAVKVLLKSQSVTPEVINTLTRVAIEKGHLDTLFVLLENTIDLEATNAAGETLLHDIARSGNEDVLIQLLTHKPAVNIAAVREDGATALYVAAENNQYDFIRTLLMYPTDAQDKDILLKATLHQAIKNNHIDIMENIARELSQAESSVLAYMAVMANRSDFLKVFIEQGINPEIKNITNGESLLYAAVKRNNPDMVSLLLKNLSLDSINAVRHDGVTPLGEAAASGNIDMVRLLLDAGANPLVRNSEGMTPLKLATQEEIRQLIKHAVDMRAVSQASNDRFFYEKKPPATTPPGNESTPSKKLN